MRIVFSSMVVAAIALAGASTAVIAQGGKAAPVTIEQHAATMKMIAQNAAAFGKAAKGADTAGASAAAEALSGAFTTIETFYTQRNKPEAIKLAQTARKGAVDAVTALKAGDMMAAQTAVGGAQATCKQCHSALRDGDGKTTPYMFKADSGITAP